MSAKPVIQIEKLSRIYKQRLGFGSQRVAMRALDAVDLEVFPGEILCVVGESGSGKSTLLRCAAALDEIDKGTVFYGGRATSKLKHDDLKRFRREVQLVLQNPRTAFNPSLTVGTSVMENVPHEKNFQQRRDEAIRLLAQVGIHESFFDRLPSELSGGELQRASIARALCSEPKVMLLDEPTSALDLSIRGQIVRLLLDLQEQIGFAMVISTHDLSLAESIADRVVVLYRGQVVEMAEGEELFTSPLHPYSFGLLESRQTTSSDLQITLTESDGTEAMESDACRLIPRCPFVEDACRNKQNLVAYRPNHVSRCWKSQDWKRLAKEKSI